MAIFYGLNLPIKADNLLFYSIRSYYKSIKFYSNYAYVATKFSLVIKKLIDTSFVLLFFGLRHPINTDNSFFKSIQFCNSYDVSYVATLFSQVIKKLVVP